jgi:hypothetical protein
LILIGLLDALMKIGFILPACVLSSFPFVLILGSEISLLDMTIPPEL